MEISFRHLSTWDMRGLFLRRLLVLGNLFWRREEGSRAELDFGEEKWRLAEILNSTYILHMILPIFVTSGGCRSYIQLWNGFWKTSVKWNFLHRCILFSLIVSIMCSVFNFVFCTTEESFVILDGCTQEYKYKDDTVLWGRSSTFKGKG